MDELFSFIIIFISSLIGLIALGLAAGFSPTLYVAQVAMADKEKKHSAYSIAIMAGVIAAIILLILLFQTIRLNTLITFIDTSLHALTVSVLFNMFVGTALLLGGIHYLRTLDNKDTRPKNTKAKQTGGVIGLFGLGFVRTIISISGITATYLAGNIIGDVSGSIIDRLIYTLVFLFATIVPFLAIVLLLRNNPRRLKKITKRFKAWLSQFNYHLIGGLAAIIVGVSIIAINLMIALFY